MSSETPINPAPLPSPSVADLAKEPLQAPSRPPGRKSTDRIVVYRHSNLFYWWPVWALGFACAFITWMDNQHLAIVPAGTVRAERRSVAIDEKGTMEVRDVLILDQKERHLKRKNEKGEEEIVQPTVYLTHHKQVGAIFFIVLLLVILTTNVPMRGLWSVLLILILIMGMIMLTIAKLWDPIFRVINQGRGMYISMGGYILVSSILFVVWLVNFLLMDRQTYMVFTPGQVRVRLEIGGQETVYDAMGMVLQRERGDLFRHWILGFGSGDLIVKPVGVEHPLLFPNVMRVAAITEGIERMMKEKVIVKSPDQTRPIA